MPPNAAKHPIIIAGAALPATLSGFLHADNATLYTILTAVSHYPVSLLQL